MSPVDDVGELDGHSAFLALHTHVGNVPPDTMGVARVSIPRAISALLADDSTTGSVQLEVLSELAAADFPEYDSAEEEYRELAARVGALGDMSADQVLDDLKAHAVGDANFLDSATASALPHEVTAFFGQDICHTFRVDVEGKQAVWLFSEFETDAPFKTVAEWVDPHNWPVRSPMVFKSMTPLAGGLEQLPAIKGGGTAWHADFEEVVQLAKVLHTDLHLDFASVDGLFAGSSYELVRSLDGEIDVDRGFLLVNDLGKTRNVKCLKVVGFTNDYWDEQTLAWACLSWTHFLKSAVRGGTQSTPGGPQRPLGDYSLSDVATDWFDCVSAAGKRYAERTVEWVESAATGYSFDEAVSDTAALWLSIAQDWSNATAEIYKNLRLLSAKSNTPVAATDVFAQLFTAGTTPTEKAPNADATATGAAASSAPQAGAAAPPDPQNYTASVVAEGYTAGKPGHEGATIAWEGLAVGDQLSCTDMARLGSNNMRVPAANVQLSVVPLSDGWAGVHLEMPVAGLLPGLYIGDVTVNNKGTRAFQIYVSKAKGSAGG